MYNGIGLQTPRGSGTNGYIQRNWAIIRKTKDKVSYKGEETKSDQLNKQPNKEILDHVRKRKIEVKCAELMEILEEQGFTAEEVAKKVESYRSILMGNDVKPPVPRDEFGRVKNSCDDRTRRNWKSRGKRQQPLNPESSSSVSAESQMVSLASDITELIAQTHPSKTDFMMNDQMMDDRFIIDDVGGFVLSAGINKFTVTTDSFISLIRSVYKSCVIVDRQFARMISGSMFQYYCIIHLWTRFAAIRRHSGLTTEEENNLLSYMESGAYLLPEPLNHYLRCIGDFTDTAQNKYYFALPRLPDSTNFGGASGGFGRVDENTHAIYEAFPAPLVSALRIMKDLAVSQGADFCMWDLPDELRPEPDLSWESAGFVLEEEYEDLSPTRNLLGWAPAIKLTQEQREAVESSDITPDNFNVTSLKSFCFNSGIFEYVGRHIRMLSERYKVGPGICTHGTGSIGQCGFIEKKDRSIRFSYNNMYCERNVRGVSTFYLDSQISIALRTYGLRMRKEDIDGISSWACYDFNEYRSVPDSWRSTRNFIFDFGNVQYLNVNATFRTIFTKKETLCGALIDKAIIKDD